MRRTQLYLDEDVWKTLHSIAYETGTTISELVREAVRERYAAGSAHRRRAMEALIGIRGHRAEFADSAQYLRGLRRGSRLERVHNEADRDK